MVLMKCLYQKYRGRVHRGRNVLKVFRTAVTVLVYCLIHGHYSRRSTGYLEQNNATMAHAVLVYRNTDIKMQFRKFREFVNFVSKPDFIFVSRKENLWVRSIDMYIVNLVLCEYCITLGRVYRVRVKKFHIFVCVRSLKVAYVICGNEKLKLAAIH
jgi:hypothetical protein